MKKNVIFKDGSGLSQILKGLKLFSNRCLYGCIYNIPAVGDISKVYWQ